MKNSRSNPIKFAVILIAASVLSFNAHAAAWVNKTRIQKITVHDWGHAVMIVTTTPASNEGCTGPSDQLLLLRSNPQFKEIYAAALTAFATKSPISGYTYGCDPGTYDMSILQRIDLLAD